MSAVDPIPLTENPRRARSARARFLIVAALGLALAAYLLGHIGFRSVFAAAASIGWRGFVLFCGWSFVVFAVLGPAWYLLAPPSAHLGPRVFIWARMVRDAASEALPFSQVGGMILGVRAASVAGIPTRLAVASMIVDVTTEMLGQLVFIGVGLVILDVHAAHTPLAHTLVRTLLFGLLAAAVAGALFMGVQRHGLSWICEKLAVRLFPTLAGHTAVVATVLREIYRRPLRIVLSVVLHFSGWIAGSIGTWIAFRFIGVHVDVLSVIAIDSLVYAARSVAFFVPNALGVQEAVYAMLAPLFGVGKEFALAVSLLKRARDIAIGIPILFAWQMLEGRRVFTRRPVQ